MSKLRNRWTVGALVAAALVTTAPAASAAVPHGAGLSQGAGLSHGAGAVPEQALRYVALGDSRASGPRLEPMHADRCSRSHENYAAKIARDLGTPHFVDVSCSAALTVNIIDIPQFVPNYWPVQIDAVTADTDLITLAVGGNDSNNLPLGALCVALIPGADRGCRHDPFTEFVATSGIERAAGGVDRVLAALRHRAPHARVYLIGQGGVAADRGCWPGLPFSDADAAWFADYFARFDAALAEVAARHDARLVDIATPTRAGGHDACATPEDRWFEGMFSDSDAQRFHLTHTGMRVVADLVLQDLRG